MANLNEIAFLIGAGLFLASSFGVFTGSQTRRLDGIDRRAERLEFLPVDRIQPLHLQPVGLI